MFERAINNLEARAQGSINDLYITIDEVAPRLTVYDDNEMELSSLSMQSPITPTSKSQLIELLRTTQEAINADGVYDAAFSSGKLSKPFAVVYSDSHFTAIEELLFLDDDTIIIDENWFSKADHELNDFFEKLMAD